MGQEAVSLSPNYCQYKLIELIWAQVKNEFPNRYHALNIANVEILANNALNASKAH